MKLYGVLTVVDGHQCGIDRNGNREFNPELIELMPFEEALHVAEEFGGAVVADERPYPQDYLGEGWADSSEAAWPR
jgi:hypothetical protein